MKATFLLICTVFAVSFSGCAADQNLARAMTLKDAFKNDFPIGVAINQDQFTGQDTNGAALITSQFNAVSPENVLKWEIVHPQPGTNGYDFALGDAYVAFGELHHMLIVGHTLVWHEQTPSWVFQDEHGRWLNGTNAADRELLLHRMHDHIQTVVGRYKGRIKIWDVVNEVLNDSRSFNDTNVLRKTSPWVRVLGMDFIVKAFEYAHEADPAAMLRYNDYSIENPAKRQRLITLIKYLQSQNVPVMAIGSQTHANLTWPETDLEDNFLTEVGHLGLPIHITELDVNGSQAGQRNQSADIRQNAQVKGGGEQLASVQEKMAEKYGDLFKVFLKHRDSVKLVTFWGVTDTDSWRSDGHPLLFDGNWQPKLAFRVVINTAE
jgi:endo-1,4-beta-xylanase